MFKRLFYSLNNNKQFARQVQVLNYLSSVHATVSINELAQQIGCSIPTLRTDIKELNNQLPPNTHVESLGKEGYYLSYSKDTSIPTVIMDLAKETDVYKIIDNIFHNKILSFDDLSHSLYLSPYTLKKILLHINNTLKAFNLSLAMSRINIIGDETHIRFFFHSFYADFNDLYVVDPDYDMNATAYQKILNSALHFNNGFLHLNFFRSTLWFMIIKKRLEHNFIVHEQPIHIDSKAHDNFDLFQSTFRTVFKNSFGLPLIPDNELTWTYTILLACISYSYPSRITDSDSTRNYLYHRDASTDLIQRVNNFLSMEFDDDILQSQSIESMRSFLINLITLANISDQFHRLSISSRAFTKESINTYYLTWMKHLQETHIVPLEFIDDVAASLAMLHFSLMNQLKTHELTAIFTFQGEPGYDDFLIRITQFMLPQNVKPIFIFDTSITPFLVSRSKADLIISNYDLPFSEQIDIPILRLSYIPNFTEWTTMRNTILELSLMSHESEEKELASSLMI